MSYWDYSHVGYSCPKENAQDVEKLLSCLGIDFAGSQESETVIINDKFYSERMGCNDSELSTDEIYVIVNKVFENTIIICESGEDDDTSDYYSGCEKSYDPEGNIMHIREWDYCYDGDEVFGESAYKYIKEESEAEAKKQNISIEWDGDYPGGEDFCRLCKKILYKHGLDEIGTRKSTKPIPEVTIENKTIISIIDLAALWGYNSLAEMITKSFDIEYVSPYLLDSENEVLKIRSAVKKRNKMPIEEVWNCYSPYVKGRKEDIEKLLNDQIISEEMIDHLERSNDIVSFRITGGAAELIMRIIREYPDLIVSCIFTGDPDFEVTVAVVISEYGYPFVTKGEIIGTDGLDDDYVMCGFEDLFEDYNEERTWEDPHSGDDWESGVTYSFPFYAEWDDSNLLTAKDSGK